ncbi:MAG: DUF167 domain-containing protein [Gallionellaceae bacterium]
MATWYRSQDGVITLILHVQPGARRSEVAGLHGEALKIRLAAPPIDGRANDALLRFIADVLEVPLRNVELRQGAQSRHKIVQVTGSRIDPELLVREP